MRQEAVWFQGAPSDQTLNVAGDTAAHKMYPCISVFHITCKKQNKKNSVAICTCTLGSAGLDDLSFQFCCPNLNKLQKKKQDRRSAECER